MQELHCLTAGSAVHLVESGGLRTGGLGYKSACLQARVCDKTGNNVQLTDCITMTAANLVNSTGQ